MTSNDTSGLFDDLPPPNRRPMTPEVAAENAAWQAYVDRFGYRPVGIGMPDLTNEQLLEAVRTGQEITGNTPEGCES